MMRVLTFLCVLFPCVADAQVQLHWYALQSLTPLDLAEGKELTELIRQSVSDSICDFDDYTDLLKVASIEPLELGLLIDHLNNAGYYIADITNGYIHHSSYVRAGYHYQKALLFSATFQAQEGVSTPIELNSLEFANLPQDVRDFLQANSTLIISEK